MPASNIHMKIRKYHRTLGFFLAGILAVYAVSGVALIFRKTELLKIEQSQTQVLVPALNAEQVAQRLELKLENLQDVDESERIRFEGSERQVIYSPESGELIVSELGYPLVLDKLISLHKATTKSPLFYLNIAFGVSLLLFTISAFFMFMPKTPMFKSGLKIAGLGFVFALLVVIFGS